MFYKLGKLLWKSGASFLTSKQGLWYYKVMQALQIKVGQLLHSAIYLATKNLFPRIPEKLNLRYIYKKEETTLPPKTYLRDL